MRGIRFILFAILLVTLVTGLSAAQESKSLTLSGKVLDPDNTPAEGALVRLFELTYNDMLRDYETLAIRECKTSSDGTFTFETDREFEGGYRYGVILATSPKWAMGWANWRITQDDQVEIQLGRPGSLAGVVVDEQGKPVSDANVKITYLLAKSGGDRRYFMARGDLDDVTTTTDAEGRFSFKGIPLETTAELLVTRPGRATIDTRLSNPGGDTLQYAVGQTDIRLTQPMESRIEGQVTSDGKAVEGIGLMVTNASNRSMAGHKPVISDADGRFTFDALTEGAYVIQIVQPREGLSDWVAPDVQATVGSGQVLRDVTVQLSKGGVLEVLITTEDGDPMEGARISVRSEEAGQWWSAQSDTEGLARIRLVAGSYSLGNVSKRDYTSAGGEQAVSIEDGKTQRLTATLRGLPEVQGVVRDPEGNPLEGVEFQVMPVRHEVTKSDAQGKFKASWDPRSWGSDSPQFVLLARHIERNLALAMEVDEQTPVLDLKLRPAVTFKGVITDKEGKPISAAETMPMLRFSNWGSSLYSYRKAAEDGRFEIPAMPDDYKVNIYAQAEGYGQVQKEVDAYNAKDGVLDCGAIELALANLTVTGRVVDVNDAPMPGVQMHTYGEGQPDHNVTTDSQGRFVVENVCEGHIRIMANVSSPLRLYGSVETEGGAVDVKIVVSPRGGSNTFVPRQPPSLAGKPLGDPTELGLDADLSKNSLLLCFWDMQQRPSRALARTLSGKVDQLKEKGITVVLVQSEPIEADTLNEWMRQYAPNLTTGRITGDPEKTRFKWGVCATPWLILTDKEGKVTTQTSDFEELDLK